MTDCRWREVIDGRVGGVRWMVVAGISSQVIASEMRQTAPAFVTTRLNVGDRMCFSKYCQIFSTYQYLCNKFRISKTVTVKLYHI